MILGFVLLHATPAAQARDLDWTTESVHFEGSTLVIRGYFANNTDVAIDRTNQFSVNVRLSRHGEWREHASSTFDDVRILIRPGQTVYHTFRIHNVQQRHFDNFDVRWHVNYHWRGHQPDEYRHWER